MSEESEDRDSNHQYAHDEGDLNDAKHFCFLRLEVVKKDLYLFKQLIRRLVSLIGGFCPKN